MIKIQDAKVFNIEGAITGMRFPMQSWEKSDSGEEYIGMLMPDGKLLSTKEKKFFIGPSDLKLAQQLIASGADSHSKFLRQIFVSMNIRAPLYWWKEMDTYKVATVANSESTMHKLASTPITVENFSFDNDLTELLLYDKKPYQLDTLYEDAIANLIEDLETLRKRYSETKDQRYWRALIQLLPSSWNQMRHWTANYQVLRNIYIGRRFHKLQEWKDFCEEIEKLPYGRELITFGVNNDEQTK